MAVSMIRTALGVSQSKTVQSSWTIQTGMQVCANATLLVHLAHDAASVTTVTWNALTLTRDVSALVAGQAEGSIWSLLSNPTSATGTLAVSWTGTDVTAKAAAATQVMGINQFVSGVGNASAGVSQISGGSTALISTTHYLTAAIGKEGISTTATRLTWSADITTLGQDNGTSGGGAATNMFLQEGFAISQAPATRSARGTGVTVTDHVLVLAAYDFADPPPQTLEIVPAQMQWAAGTGVAGVSSPSSLGALRIPIKPWRGAYPPLQRSSQPLGISITTSTTYFNDSTDMLAGPGLLRWTIMGWVYLRETAAAVDGMFDRGGPAQGRGVNVYRYQGLLNFGNWFGQNHPGTTPMLNDRWYHVAVICSATTLTDPTIVAYLDGRMELTRTGPGDDIQLPDEEGLTIGTMGGDTSLNMNGLLASIKMWVGVALTPAQIVREMGQRAPVFREGLWGFWDDPSGMDASGENHPLTRNGAIGIGMGPPIPWTILPRRVVTLGTSALGGGATTLAVVSGAVAWQAQTLLLSRCQPVSPAYVKWQAMPPALTRLGALQPGSMSWQAAAGVLTQTISATSGGVVAVPARAPSTWPRVRIPRRTGPNLALRFDNAADCLSATTELPPITAWTVMGWWKVLADPNDYQCLMKFGPQVGTVDYELDLAADGTTLMAWNGSGEVNGTTLTLGTWYHIAMTCAGTGSNAVRVYLNGRLDITTDGNVSVLPDAMTIGKYAIDNAVIPFNGCVQDLFVYNTPLTQGEIVQQMQRRWPVRVAHLNRWSPILSKDTAHFDYAGARHWDIGGELSVEDGVAVPWQSRVVHFYVPRVAATGHRIQTVTPARMQWQARTPAIPRILTVTRAQSPWQAQGLVGTRVGTVQPGRLIWQVQAGVQTRSALAQPSQFRWAAQSGSQTRGVQGSPAQLKWYPSIATLGAGETILAATPAWMQWWVPGGVAGVDLGAGQGMLPVGLRPGMLYGKPSARLLHALRGRWREHPRYESCVAHWLLGEGTGRVVQDVASRDPMALVASSPPPAWEVEARQGLVQRLTGSTYLEGTQVFRQGFPFTVTAMIKKSVGGTDTFLVHAGDAGAVPQGWAFWITASDNLAWTIGETGRESAGSLIQPEVWYFIAVVHAAGNEHRFYVVELEAGTVVLAANTTGSANIALSNYPLTVGMARVDGVPSLYGFDGALKEVRIYARALSDEDLWSLATDPYREFLDAARRTTFVPFGAAELLGDQSAEAVPSRVAWAAESVVGIRIGLVSPVQVTWRAATSGASIITEGTTLTVVPAQMVWQRQFPVLSRRVGSSLFLPGRRTRTPRMPYDQHRGVERTHPLNQGLLVWYLAQPWMFPGERWYDLTGHRDATLLNMRGWQATERPGGRGELRFNGVVGGDRLSFVDVTLPTNIFTISLWLRIERNQVNHYATVFTPTSGDYGIYIGNGEVNQPLLNYYDGTDRDSASILPLEAWVHLVVTSHGAGIRQYINGVLDNTHTFTVTVPTYASAGNNPFSQPFRGAMDDIRLYNRALTGADVEHLYRVARTGNTALLDAPARLWIAGGRRDEVISPHQNVGVVPARMPWQTALFPVTPDVVSVEPSRLQWRAVRPELFAITTTALILAPARLLATPRLRYPLAVVAETNHALNQELLAWYLAQPWMATGNQWFDAVGGLHGTMQGMDSVLGVSGIFPTTRPLARGEFRFQGGDMALTLPDVRPPTALFTVALWVYRYPVDAQGYGGLVVDNANLGLFSNAGTVNWFDEADDPGEHVATTLIADLTWTHVMVTTSATGVQFYINGDPAGTSTYTTGSPSIPTFQWMGNSDQAETFGGWVDDVRLYGRALTDVEARLLYDRSLAGNQGLVRVPKRIFAVGSVHQALPTDTIAVVPARMQWHAIVPVVVPTVEVMPAQMRWQRQTSILSGVAALPPGAIILTQGRRLVSGRLRFPAVEGVQELHPLNRGLLGWYMTQPWMMGGNKWDELVNGYDATLTTTGGNTRPEFRATARPGGRGEVVFHGGDSIAAIPTLDVGSNRFTVALWICPLVALDEGEYGALIVESDNRGLFYTDGTLDYYEFGVHVASASVPPFTWSHVAVVSTGDGVTFYLNGGFAGTVSYGVGAVAFTQIGRDEVGFGFLGAMDDIRVYNRTLAPWEIFEVYKSSLTGSLDTLQFPRKLWMLGGVRAPLRIAPARLAWQGQAPRFNPVRLVEPARLQWRAQVATVVRTLPPVITVTAGMRRLVQPRVRYAPIVGVNHQFARRYGLLYWFMAQPWQFAGHQWMEMVHGKAAGFLNMPATDGVSGWQSTTRPGGRGALGFDGTARGVVVESDHLNSGLTQLTLSAWVYPRSFGGAGKGRILDKMGIDGFGGFYLALNTVETTSRTVEFGVDGSTTMIAFASNNVIDVHTWTHITVVWDGTYQRANVHIYLNGVEVGIQTGSIGQDGVAPPNPDAANPLYLGNRDALDRGFDGLLDDIRLYTRPLVPSEVQHLYRDSLTGSFALLQRPRLPLPLGGVVITEPPFLMAVTPSRVRWQAHVGSVTRNERVSVSPARLQWQAQSLRVTRSAGVNPARMQWMARTTALTQAVRVGPGQVKWEAQRLGQGGIMRINPAQVKWQMAVPLLAGCLVLQAGRIKWQAQGVRLTRRMGVVPGRMVWEVHTLRRGGVLQVEPARLTWRAYASLRVATYYPFRQYVWRQWRY